LNLLNDVQSKILLLSRIFFFFKILLLFIWCKRIFFNKPLKILTTLSYLGAFLNDVQWTQMSNTPNLSLQWRNLSSRLEIKKKQKKKNKFLEKPTTNREKNSRKNFDPFPPIQLRHLFIWLEIQNINTNNSWIFY
jgi:hypothetical protein